MRQQRRNWRPVVEPIERRQLPASGLLVALQAQVNRPSPNQIIQLGSTHGSSRTPTVAALATTTPSGTSTAAGVYSANGQANTNANGVSGQPVGPNANAPLPLSPVLGNGTPSRAELARERFVARFQGPMATLPPRFSDQSKIIYLRGLGGSTPNFFLHGDYSLAIVFPARFNAQSPGGSPAVVDANGTVVQAAVPPVTGFAFLDDKNNNSGGTVGLDLSADPTSFDSKGRPTRLVFTSDPNIYSGIFFVSQSSGVVSIKYGPGNTATSTFNGRLYTSGLTSPFQNIDLYAKHSG